jgi:Zn-dependent membrane protease YugP
MFDIGYLIIMGVFSFAGFLVSNRLKSKFAHYAQVPTRNGQSGRDIAEAMLSHYNIRDVQIVEGQGFLSDHYNPQTKVVALSPEVYHGRTISAAAVAAHECGHAVQHAQAYSMLTLRSRLVPVVQFSANIQQFLFIGAMLSIGSSFGPIIMMIVVVTFGITALFSLVTLPVEFDASNRALAWLDNSNNMSGTEYDGAKDALWWAAMTYVTQALAALVMFLYFLLRYLGSSQD